MACSEDYTLSPVSGCKCISNKEASALYPDWATEKDIEISKMRANAAFEMLSTPPKCYYPEDPIEPLNPEGPGNWPECKF